MYQAPLKPSGQPRWYEVLRADDRNWAEYVAGLLHNAGTPASPETKPVLKVVKYGNTLLALPDEARVVVKSVNVEHFSARRLSSTAIDHLKRRSRGGWSHIVFINSGVQSYRFYSLCPTPPTSKHGSKVRTAHANARNIELKIGHFHRQCEHFGYAPLVNLHLSRIVNRERRRFLKRPMVELLNLCAKIPPFTPKPAHSSSKLPIVKDASAGNLAEGSDKSASMIGFWVQGSDKR